MNGRRGYASACMSVNIDGGCYWNYLTGGESPGFNYFRNFGDPVSVLLSQRKWDLQQRHSTATAASALHSNLPAHLPEETLVPELVLTQQGLLGSPQPEAAAPGQQGDRQCRAPGAQIADQRRDKRYIGSLHRSLACRHQGQAPFTGALVHRLAISGLS
ncbi:unnamed protein product [Pleuronectes platessa]|uniref:Uncharacterized protein n=1 Tax=Pleuronectes platessa TaxID=8262 RepID=A0A9N7ZAG8_PLEPL|nr:unnamed protein product [Pleuronectes platessa]